MTVIGIFKATIFSFQTQFMGLIFIFGRLLFKSDCEYPKWVCYVFVPQNLFMLFLFSDFYVKTYVTNKKNKQKS